MDWKTLKETEERKNKLVADAKAIQAKCNDEKRDFTANEEKRFDEMLSDADKLKKQCERIAKVLSFEGGDSNENRSSETPGRQDVTGADGQEATRSGGPQISEEERDRRADLAMRAYMLRGQAVFNDLTPELRAEIRTEKPDRDDLPDEVRALSTAGVGGVVGTRPFSKQVIKSLRIWTGVIQAGATIIRTSNGNQISALTVDDTANSGAGPQAESASAADNVDPTIGKKQWGAHTYDSNVIRVPVELIQDTEVDLASLLAELCTERIGVKMNTEFTTGDGVGNPQGVLVGAGAGKTAAAQAAFTGDELIDLQMSVAAPYRMMRPHWMMNSTTLAAVRKLKDGDNRYLFAHGPADEPDLILGNPYVENPAFPNPAASAEPIAYGAFSRYHVRMVGQPVVLRLNELYATDRQVGIYVYHRADGLLSDAAAIKTLTMAA